MTSSQPPRLATWILQRFASGRAKEPLLGDLVEEYNSGRSRVWYWRQVITAILVDSCRQVRTHYVLAARAIAVGWSVSYLLWIIWFHVRFPRLPLKAMPLFFGGNFIYPGAPSFFVYAGVGWVVGRLHRPYAATMSVVYEGWCLLCTAPELYRLTVDVTQHTRYAPYWIHMLAGILVAAAGTLAGGLLSASQPASPERVGTPV